MEARLAVMKEYSGRRGSWFGSLGLAQHSAVWEGKCQGPVCSTGSYAQGSVAYKGKGRKTPASQVTVYVASPICYIGKSLSYIL